MSHYTHFTINEREQTMVFLAQGLSVRKIAQHLCRSPSTISREIRRNAKQKSEYSASFAGKAYKRRRKKCHPKLKLKNPDIEKYVVEKLMLKWSPEQIAGRGLLEDNPVHISFPTIYRAVANRVFPIALHKEMRIKSKHRIPTDCKTGKILNVLTIHDRPQQANDKLEYGHWESDTVHGRRKTGDIATHVERKSGYLIALKLENRKSKTFNTKTQSAFKKLPEKLRKSFTVDRGPEFYGHKDLFERTGMPVYFCDAGCPGQRGLNENTNGLLRQYFPKGKSLKGITQKDIDSAVSDLNNRPRKRFGFLTPAEIILKCCT